MMCIKQYRDKNFCWQPIWCLENYYIFFFLPNILLLKAISVCVNVQKDKYISKMYVLQQRKKKLGEQKTRAFSTKKIATIVIMT